LKEPVYIPLPSRFPTVTIDRVSEQPEKKAVPEPKSDPNPEIAKPSLEPGQLSAEEQMALYENELKETDWGHQPC
jgi:hypothetical protein